MSGDVGTATSGWSAPVGGRLPVLAALAVLADAVTTAAFLSAGVGTERNGLLVAGLEHGIPGGALVFVATQGLLLAGAWLPFGALSTYLGTYLVVTMGLGGGLNNAVLLLTGGSLLAPLGPTWGYLAPPVLATGVGFVAVWRLHDEPNPVAVTAVAGVLLWSEVVSLLL
jgi:hypothetical protein